MIDAVDVHVELGGRTVLAGASLSAAAGELVALVGPNGAGKSTVLAVLAGDLRPSAGRVELDGRDLATFRPRALARRRAVLPQGTTVAFPFTVADVVAMGRAPCDSDATADDLAVDAALVELELTELADRPVPALSGGEQARVAMARVLVQDAPLLLLDEPTAALDVRHQELLLAAVRRRVDAGGSAVVVVHDLDVAAAHADRAAVLVDGRVTAAGPPVDVLTPALLGAAYGHDVDVVDHPRTGRPLVLPRRAEPLRS